MSTFAIPQSTLQDMAAEGAPGIVCAIRLNGDLLWGGAAGYADRDKSVLLQPSGRFCVFSITKSFTAAAYLRMRSHYQLQLDESIHRWFPDIAPNSAITLRHLFRHTSGIRDYGSSQKYFEAVRASPSVPWTEEEYLAETLERGLLFEPGARWSYSNVGYLLLKRVMELEFGSSLKKCLATYVFEPLELSNSYVAETIADWAGCVPGYAGNFTDGQLADVRTVYHPGWCAPGVAVSTIQDVTSFYTALFQGDFLSDGDRADLTDLTRVPGKHPPAVKPSYGMGIMADPEGPFGPSFGHGGEGPGYSLAATVLPGHRAGCLSVAVFRNGSHGLSGGKSLNALLPGVLAALED